ncbi:MAG: putative outer rane lipoprotein [Belnapia sp.]|nr:putative outer rane lipoprotein [Belnapia sp.]
MAAALPSSGPGRRSLLLALALAGCATRPLPEPRDATGPFTRTIHVIERGWHTDIALPVAALDGALRRLAQDFPGAVELVFGFGDRAYLLEAGASPLASPLAYPLAMLRALLPGRGAILLTALAVSPVLAFGADDVVPLPLSAAEFGRLQGFIAASLDRGGLAPGDRLPPIADGPYPGSVFHASTITYAASYTCNTWTAEALAVAGLPLSPSGVLLAHQVMARARRAAALRPVA